MCRQRVPFLIALRRAAGRIVLAWLLAGCSHSPSTSLSATPTPTSTPQPYSFLGLPDHDENRGRLRAYYREKYSQSQIAAVRSTVEDVFSDYGPDDKSQAMAELLAFSHVVFHVTPHHNLERNHRAIRPHETKLKELCQTYKVPLWPVLAIVSWENSGGSSQVSWADAAGLGQMTWGAIDQAHQYAEHEATLLPAGDPLKLRMAKIVARHTEMCKRSGLPDERFVPECNLEDVVLFFKFLYTKYGGASDHAIGAYHKGLTNHDDILRDFIKRKEGSCPDPIRQRPEFIEAIRRLRINYLTLWNDKRCREMLNGLRTLDGDQRTRQNAGQALGDESDIYPWKVVGSLAAYRQGPEYVTSMQSKYAPSQVEVEVAGLPLYTTPEQIAESIKVHDLVRSQQPLSDLGIDHNVSAAHRDMAYSVTPELEGYLWSLTQRWRQRVGNQELRLPAVRLLAVGDWAAGRRSVNERAQLRGITVQLSYRGLDEKNKEALRAELEVDYLLDRVYRVTLSNHNPLVCLNPRFGHEFMDLYERYQRGEETGKAHEDPSPAPTASPDDTPMGPEQPIPGPHDVLPTPDSGDGPKKATPKASVEI